MRKKPTTNEPNEFPDLLGSDNNLATLNSNFDYTHYDSSDEKINQLLKSSTIKEESGLTFATLSGLDPVYPDVDISTLAVKQESVVVAKKSVAPTMENTIPEVKSESVDRQHDSNVEVVQGNIAPNIAAAPKTEPQVNQAGISSKPDTSSLTFTIQYNIPQAAEATAQPTKEKNQNQWPDVSLKDSEVYIDQLAFEKIEDDIEKHIQCPDCDYRTDRQSNFNRHCKITHNMVRFSCDFCDKYFSDRCSLAGHINSSHEKKMHNCEFCPFTATRAFNLKLHIKSIYFNVKHQCKECEYSTSSNQALHKHVQARHKGINYLCPVEGCNFKTLNKMYLKRHFKHVHEQTQHRCQEEGCNYSSTTEDNLKYHIRTVHSGIRYTCD